MKMSQNESSADDNNNKSVEKFDYTASPTDTNLPSKLT